MTDLLQKRNTKYPTETVPVESSRLGPHSTRRIGGVKTENLRYDIGVRKLETRHGPEWSSRKCRLRIQTEGKPRLGKRSEAKRFRCENRLKAGIKNVAESMFTFFALIAYEIAQMLPFDHQRREDEKSGGDE